jgi:hypothetical protein
MFAQNPFSFPRSKSSSFSGKSFLSILQTKQSFNISALPNISGDLIILDFEEIFLLFSNKSEILISKNTIIAFQYLSEVLENSVLFSICQNVLLSGDSQAFFFTSELFAQIPKDILNSIQNFRIHFNNCDIECNSFFASLISNKILNQIENSSNCALIYFSDYSSLELIHTFFGILQGKVIEINESNVKEVSDTLSFLEFDSHSIQNIVKHLSFDFFSNDISSLHSLSIDSIQTVISSYFLHIKNEDQLFEFIKNLIKENRSYLTTLEYISFGLISFPDFMNLIYSIQFHELNFCLLESMRSSFFSNYILLFGSSNNPQEIQSLFLISGSLANYTQVEKENQELKLIFESYPKLCTNVLQINSFYGNVLKFTIEDKNLILKYRFIRLINGTREEFEKNNSMFPLNCLFIFVPISVKYVGEYCFQGCSSL